MSVKKNIFYSVALNVLSVLFPIVTAPYISRVLGVDNIGIIRFTSTYVGYFALFAALGIGYYGVRELAKYKDDQEKCSRLFSSLFFITFCSTLVVTLVFLLTINTVPSLREYRLLLSVAGISLYIVPVTMDWYFQAKENFRIITIRSFVVKMLALISIFIFVRERNDILPYILIATFSIVGTQLWNLSYAYKTGLRIDLRNLELRRHLKPMFVFLWSTVAIGVYVMIDTVMLGFLSTFEQVGYYTSPNLVLSMITGACMAINTVLLPRLSHNREQEDEVANTALLQKAFDLNSLFIVPITTGAFLVASRFVPLFFGGEFAGCIVPMQIMSLKVILWVLNNFFVLNVLFVFGLEKKFLLVATCTALLSFAFNWLLIPRFGAIGTAIVSIAIGGLFQIGYNLFFVYKRTNIRLRWNALGLAILLSLSFFVVYYICDKFISHDVLFLSIFIPLSIIAYIALQLLAKNYLARQMWCYAMNKLKINIRHHGT